ncbi:hypothetical protein BB559_002548 [Furculomyces boomerangus]|uniref:Uncharacterized protein n=1 Tax=Furculomyces boomerangus TaxID=61424 RepID=A0A2T9YUG7_9FUNG|nr:hypothetical protein BB559_002548 [Furculomyces boomerangus]
MVLPNTSSNIVPITHRGKNFKSKYSFVPKKPIQKPDQKENRIGINGLLLCDENKVCTKYFLPSDTYIPDMNGFPEMDNGYLALIHKSHSNDNGNIRNVYDLNHPESLLSKDTSATGKAFVNSTTFDCYL